MNFSLTILVTLIVIAVGDSLSISGGIVPILPTLLICAINQNRYVEAAFWLIGLLVGQYFNSLPWIIIIFLPILIAVLFIIRRRLIGSHSTLMNAIVIGGLFIPVLLVSGIREGMAIIGSVIWIVGVSWVRDWLIERYGQPKLKLNQS